jgi:LPXTG-site transpeptidase (sortase) family protein
MRRMLVKIGAWLAILLGLAMMLQPTAADWLTRQRNSKTAQQFAANTSAEAPLQTDAAAEPERAYPELYAAMQAYNEAIFADGQSGLIDAFAYENPPLDLTDYGYDEEVLAMLWIPRLDLELPVYLGASRENMAKGAALLGQTSMPLGGENTNTVLAAHRGYYGAEMLRNVQQIQVGDKIQLTTPWDTLIYRVAELKIIDPADISSVLIQPGRDLLTLSTCHPYTQNYQRYLVIAERDPDAAVTDKDIDLQESEATWDASPRQVTMETDGTTSIAEVEPQSITPLPQEGSAESEGSAVSNLMIWLENNALWAGFVFIAACVGVLAI